MKQCGTIETDEAKEKLKCFPVKMNRRPVKTNETHETMWNY